MRFALTLAAVSAALVGLAQPAPATISNSVCHAAGGAICSKAFRGEGACNGSDQLAVLETPWEKRPIAIVGVAMQISLSGGSLLTQLAGIRPWVSAFAGNSAEPDVMATLAQEGRQAEKTTMFASGEFFAFPAAAADPPHVDLHVSCGRAAHYSALLVIFYRFADEPPPALTH